MENYRPDFRSQQQHHTSQPTFATTVASGIALLYVAYQVAVYYDYPILPPQELVWNALVYLSPKQLLLDSARRQELMDNGMLSQTHAAKSEVLRRILGMGGNAMLQKLPAEGIMRGASSLGARMQSTKPTSDAPAGLGNWDNSCYQNSVLQGLASLDSVKSYLQQAENRVREGEDSTTESLLETVNRLNDPDNNGRQLWTPAKLKSMSSWQQQDAQEYFSKIMDELDKEAAKSVLEVVPKPGLESIVESSESPMLEHSVLGDAAQDTDVASSEHRNPLDGLLAQKVTCTHCGHSDGLSMIPFNCLTIPLGSAPSYSIEECLDEYTKLEEIPEVECGKCTLLRAQQQLERMLPPPPSFGSVDTNPPINCKTLSLPPELRAQAFARLSAIQQALEKDDFEDKTLTETCSIPKKSRVSSTKTRQAVIGRSPKSLVVHVNRSVFDELTGVQRKNYASVRFPARLDLSSWMVRTEDEDELDNEEAEYSMPNGSSASSTTAENIDELIYRIKAVVTHYGRHENGHYICYRQHPVQMRQDEDDVPETREPEDDDPQSLEAELPQATTEELRWWRLSDEDVSSVSESEVLAQNGVFMLFYEREDLPQPPSNSGTGDAASAETQAARSGVDVDAIEVEDIADAPAFLVPSAGCSGSASVQAEGSSTEDTAPTASTTPTTPSMQNESEDFVAVPMERDTPLEQISSPKATRSFMRTARQPSSSKRGHDRAFGESGFRAVAAT
ncbi:ubiquitin-specific protease ubp1 [Extremus antarcticus]|uniref:ubiquitinyl hydrolase 1 n=1 Tax=Extremus antarcticus TaxID=702011 RepID=A0AAJ0GJR0_9PEZI|nr:ubiquitin-specific protease ubp1 [Extremus antarcticus]